LQAGFELKGTLHSPSIWCFMIWRPVPSVQWFFQFSCDFGSHCAIVPELRVALDLSKYQVWDGGGSSYRSSSLDSFFLGCSSSVYFTL